MTLYVGTSGFAYKEWKGSFYPADLPANRMLAYYSEHFRAVEINSTFRRIPSAASLSAWAADVPTRFKFVLKAPEQITHRKRLKNVAGPLARFLSAAEVFERRKGPVFFQLPPNFKKDVPRLSRLLARLPKKCRAAVEFRHPSWFDDEVFELLRKHNSALCIADTDEDLQVPFVATANWGYLRLRRSNYRSNQLKSWASRIHDQPWRDAFVFLRHEDEGKGPRFASQLIEFAG